MSSMYFLGGYYGTQYRVRFYPPFGIFSILYKEYNLTRFNHQKNTTHIVLTLNIPELGDIRAWLWVPELEPSGIFQFRFGLPMTEVGFLKTGERSTLSFYAQLHRTLSDPSPNTVFFRVVLRNSHMLNSCTTSSLDDCFRIHVITREVLSTRTQRQPYYQSQARKDCTLFPLLFPPARNLNFECSMTICTGRPKLQTPNLIWGLGCLIFGTAILKLLRSGAEEIIMAWVLPLRNWVVE